LTGLEGREVGRGILYRERETQYEEEDRSIEEAQSILLLLIQRSSLSKKRGELT